MSLSIACLYPVLDQPVTYMERSPEASDVTSAADKTLQCDDDTLGGEGKCALSFSWYNVKSREIKFDEMRSYIYLYFHLVKCEVKFNYFLIG